VALDHEVAERLGVLLQFRRRAGREPADQLEVRRGLARDLRAHRAARGLRDRVDVPVLFDLGRDEQAPRLIALRRRELGRNRDDLLLAASRGRIDGLGPAQTLDRPERQRLRGARRRQRRVLSRSGRRRGHERQSGEQDRANPGRP